MRGEGGGRNGTLLCCNMDVYYKNMATAPAVDNRVSPGKGKDMLFEDMRNARATYTNAVLIATRLPTILCHHSHYHLIHKPNKSPAG